MVAAASRDLVARLLLFLPILWPPGFMIYTGDMQTSRRADQIAKLKQRRQQIAAKARDADKRLADRLRQLQADEAKTERKRETRRKIVIGAIVRAAQMSQTEISLRWLEAQIHALKRPDDRALFGLDLEPSADAAGADKSEPAGCADHLPAEEAAGRTRRGASPARAGAGRQPRRARAGKAWQGEGGFADPSGARPRQPAGAAR